MNTTSVSNEVCGCKTKLWTHSGRVLVNNIRKAHQQFLYTIFRRWPKTRSLWCMGSHVIFCFFFCLIIIFERLCCSCNLGRKQIFDFEALAFLGSSCNFLFLRLVIGLRSVRVGFNGQIGVGRPRGFQRGISSHVEVWGWAIGFEIGHCNCRGPGKDGHGARGGHWTEIPSGSPARVWIGSIVEVACYVVCSTYWECTKLEIHIFYILIHLAWDDYNLQSIGYEKKSV